MNIQKLSLAALPATTIDGDLVYDYNGNEKLYQVHEFRLGKDYSLSDGEKNLSVLCNTLILDGEFINPSGILTIICNKFYCNNNGVINLSGNRGNDANPPIQLSNCTPDNPNGTNANVPGGDGGYGGYCRIYFSELYGDLNIFVDGGNGGTGQRGADGCNGRDGLDGGNDQNGGNGVPPGLNGNGYTGGHGGNAGTIELSSTLQLAQQQQLSPNKAVYSFNKDSANMNGTITCSYAKGTGGNGGTGGQAVTHGGKGGQGGLVKWKDTVETEHGTHTSIQYGPMRKPNGSDFSQVINGLAGNPGFRGNDGNDGSATFSSSFEGVSAILPSSFLRIQIFHGEYFYINSNKSNNLLSEAVAIFSWLTQLKSYLPQDTKTIRASVISTLYLEDEDIAVVNYQYELADIHLNQINLGLDYFGNVNNYVTLLDNNYINDRILALKNTFVALEDLTLGIIKKDLQYQEGKALINSKITENNKKTDTLKSEIQNQNEKIFSLNTDILNRTNQISDFKNRILNKEAAFKNAVENASSGCSVVNALTAIGSVVSIVAGVASGVGAVAAVFTVANDAVKLKNNFINNVDSIGPWISPERWKNVFTTGGDHNIVNQIKGLNQGVADFNSNVKSLHENFNRDNGENKSLLAVSYDGSDPDSFDKKKFMDQMKDYVGKFPEAKAYQDEVLSYIDFCDVTNQKRLDFTNTFLNIIALNNQINQTAADNDKLKLALLKADTEKVSSSIKALVQDSYYKSLQFCLQLIYLQQKAIDYFTLEPSTFDSNLYNLGINGIFTSYVNNNIQTLTKYLINNGTSRELKTTPLPIIISEQTYPAAFSDFKDGMVNPSTGKKVHTITFDLNPVRGQFLSENSGNWSEIYLVAARVIIPNLQTKKGFISLNLTHAGNSFFIKHQLVNSKPQSVYFSHKPLTQEISYEILNERYTSPFTNIFAPYQVENKTVYVGISPFANWTIQINENVTMNDGLDLSKISEIKLYFDFYQRPFDNV